jgi:hypothetical protein
MYIRPSGLDNKCIKGLAPFEFLMAISIKITGFKDITSQNLTEIYHR